MVESMNFGHEVRTLVADLEETLRLSRRLDNDFKDHRLEAVQQRRDLSAKLAGLSKAAQTIPEEGARAAFMNQFSKMRYALALHQASWPIVAIVQEDPDYRTSIESARDAYQKFFAWVRAQ